MRVLANENIPMAAIAGLRSAGWDVLAVAEVARSASDADVLALARREARVIITFDRDYGELIFARHHPVPAGVVYLPATPMRPEEPARWLLGMASQGLVLEGYFTIFSGWDHVRQRVLPSD